METGIYLTQSVLAGLSERARAEIARTLFPSAQEADDWDAEVVRLTQREADDFVSNCSEKTLNLLQVMVASGGEMSHHAITSHFGMTAAQLKSAFGGLTKRARTIARKKKAKLIQWEQVGGEWIAYIHPTSVKTLGVALAKVS